MMPTDPKTIAVIRLSSIGDILLATPLLRVLRQRFPSAKIDFVVKAAYVDLIRTNPHLDQIWILDSALGKAGLNALGEALGAAPYDLLIDIHKNFRSLFLRRHIHHAAKVVLKKYYCKRFLLVKTGWNLYREIVPVHQRYIDAMTAWGVEDDGLGLEFHVDAEIAAQIKTRLDPLLKEQIVIGLAPGAGFATKRWPSEYYLELARQLQQQRRAKIVLFGGPGDTSITGEIAAGLSPGAVDLAGQLSLMESAAALMQCDVVVTNDTGLMHLASALRVPLVALFGPTTRELGFFPLGDQSQVVEIEGLACRPCTHMGNDRCPKKHFRCMRDIAPERVAQRIFHQLDTATAV